MDSIQGYWILSFIIILGYLGMINIIYFLAPNRKWNTFPEKCKVHTKCTRVADSNNRGYGLKPIQLNDTIENVQRKIVQIIKKKSSMKIINEKEGFIHATDVTPFFRFHDDLAIRIFESGNKVNIWLQSQSRLGIYDLNVNEKRVQEIHKKISALA